VFTGGLKYEVGNFVAKSGSELMPRQGGVQVAEAAWHVLTVFVGCAVPFFAGDFCQALQFVHLYDIIYCNEQNGRFL
ncbi:MAG: hypothetical protein ACI3U2_00080, partial [Anaerovibrio sp.]